MTHCCVICFLFLLNYLFRNSCHQLDCKPHEGSTNHCVSLLTFLECDTIAPSHKLLLRMIVITCAQYISSATLMKD